MITIAVDAMGGKPCTCSEVERRVLASQECGLRVLLDVGANVDSKPERLLQFAVMGKMYYRLTFGSRNQHVGLLSIEEEEIKGNELTRGVRPYRTCRCTSSGMWKAVAFFLAKWISLCATGSWGTSR